MFESGIGILPVEKNTSNGTQAGSVNHTQAGSLCHTMVPLSNRYVRGQRAILVSVDGETATLQFPNGATLAKVQLRDLVDDSGYWKS